MDGVSIPSREPVQQRRARTHFSHVAVALQGRGTAAHIRGRNPASARAVLLRPPAAVLLRPPRGRAPASGGKGWRIRSEIKKSQSSAHEDIPWFASRPNSLRSIPSSLLFRSVLMYDYLFVCGSYCTVLFAMLRKRSGDVRCNTVQYYSCASPSVCRCC